MKKLTFTLALAAIAGLGALSLRADDTSTNSAPASTNNLAAATIALPVSSLDTNAVSVAGLDTNATLSASN
ncbi:MAG TPA: hypothetical protein VK742_03005 [Candidatus Sulfotelmatobacter sp.]|jgi:hypothetical protein|nr:hypothetical protein [Candidatus Sulfotelmatobacter sp.]